MLRIAVNHKTREFWTNCVSPALPVISGVLFPEYYVIAALKSSCICGMNAIPAVAGTKQNYVRATLVAVRINTQSSGALYGKISQQHIIKCRLLGRVKMCLPECAIGFCNWFRLFGSISIRRYCTTRTETQKKKTYSETITVGKIPTSSFTRIHGVPPTRVTRFGLRIGVRVGTIVNRVVGKGQGEHGQIVYKSIADVRVDCLVTNHSVKPMFSNRFFLFRLMKISLAPKDFQKNFLIIKTRCSHLLYCQ